MRWQKNWLPQPHLWSVWLKLRVRPTKILVNSTKILFISTKISFGYPNFQKRLEATTKFLWVYFTLDSVSKRYIDTVCCSENLHSQMSTSRRQSFWFFVQNIYSSSPYAVFKIKIHIHIITVQLPQSLFFLVYLWSELSYIWIFKIPLIISIVFEHFKTFLNTSVNSTHSENEIKFIF